MAERTLQNSFIPKTGGDKKTAFSTTASIANMIGGGIFLVVALVALGLFLYTAYLNNAIDTLTEKIAEEAGKIDQKSLQDLQSLDTRLGMVEKLLANHVAPAQLLSLISNITVQNVSLDSVDIISSGGGQYSLQIIGIAPNFRTVAAQEDIYRANTDLQNALVTDFTLEQTQFGDEVKFTMQAQIRRDAMLLSKQTTSFKDKPRATETEDPSTLDTGVDNSPTI